MTRPDRFAYGFFLAALAAFFLLIVFGGCAATYAAGKRRMAEHQLATCRRGTVSGAQARPCYATTQAYCRDAGLERTCGEGGPR